MAVPLVGAALSIGASHELCNVAERDEQVAFERLVMQSQNLVRERIGIYDYGLRGARGIFVASQEVTRGEFAAYAASREPDVEFPGALGLGFVRRVPRVELPALVAQQRTDGYPGFTVRGQGGGDEAWVIEYLEPLAGNEPALGFDISSEAKRRAAADRAMRTGETILTEPVTLLEAADEGPGFLYMLPFYRAGAPHGTEAERVAALEGWIYMPIVMARAMRGVTALSDHQLDVEVFDGPIGRDRCIYDGDGGMLLGGREREPYAERGHIAFDRLSIGGRRWTVVTSSTPRFQSASRLPAVVVFGGGVLLSGMLALLFVSLGRSRARAEALAEAMTVDLRQKSLELERQALIDSLTGLPNRALLYDRVQQAILAAPREPQRTFAVLFIDLDDFKRVNDTLGHGAGDRLLRAIADRLCAAVRSSDTVAVMPSELAPPRESTVARLGGDEFVVLLQRLAKPDDARLVADRILAALAQPVDIEGTVVHPVASVGIAVATPRHKVAEDLVREADQAMYRAKALGKGRAVEFSAA